MPEMALCYGFPRTRERHRQVSGHRHSRTRSDCERRKPGRAYTINTPKLNSLPINRKLLFLLALFLASLWIGTLNYRSLVRPDEGRYAEIPREMVATGDWLTPRLNGIKYFEKPPLQYWATASAYTVFGEHHWTARLWTALCGFLCVLLTFFGGRRLFGETAAFYSALVLAGSPGFIMVAQINTLDMGLTLFMSATMMFFLLGLKEKKTAWLMAAWAASALAVLSKGLAGFVLPGGVLVAYALLHRDWRLLLSVRWGWGLLIFFIIAAPWFVLVQRANPEFFDFFFIHEHFSRFSSGEHRRPGAWWYFIPVLVFGLLPWLPQLPRALWNGWKATEPAGQLQPARFLLLWCVLIFLFFSASGSKLPSYILPIFPALALLLGRVLCDVSFKTLLWQGAALGLGAVAIVAYAPHVTRWASEKVPVELFALYSPWLVAAGIAGLVGCGVAIGASRRQMRHTAIIAIAIGMLSTAQIAALGHHQMAPSYSAHGLATRILPHLNNEAKDIPFYSVHTYDQTLDFYIKRTVTLVEYADLTPTSLTFKRDLTEEEWSKAGQALHMIQAAD